MFYDEQKHCKECKSVTLLTELFHVVIIPGKWTSEITYWVRQAALCSQFQKCWLQPVWTPRRLGLLLPFDNYNNGWCHSSRCVAGLFTFNIVSVLWTEFRKHSTRIPPETNAISALKKWLHQLLSEILKMGNMKTIIFACYFCENWSLSLKEEHKS